MASGQHLPMEIFSYQRVTNELISSVIEKLLRHQTTHHFQNGRPAVLSAALTHQLRCMAGKLAREPYEIRFTIAGRCDFKELITLAVCCGLAFPGEPGFL